VIPSGMAVSSDGKAVPAAPAGPEPLLKLRGISKHFGAVQALYQVDLDLPAGQVTALCGDNGAGKSVLTKCIAGIHQPDQGEMFWEGRPVHIRSPRDSAGLGIETVYQDLALFDGERKLDIEVDGENYHRNWDGELCRRDQIRSRRLSDLGWDIERFWVYEIRDNLAGSVRRVRVWANALEAAGLP